MTRGEIRQLCLYWLDDLQGAYFTPVQMNVFINNAQREVQKQLVQSGEDYYLKVLQTITVMNQGDYVLPDDFFNLRRLELVTSGTGINENKIWLTPITLNQQDIVLNLGNGTPNNYVLKQNRFTIYPYPDQSDMPLRLYYAYRVQDMTSDNDVPDIPQDYHEYIAVLATLDGFIKDDRSNKNITDKKNYYLQLMKQVSDDRKRDQSRQVVQRDLFSSDNALW